jgi:hypothetical protein
MKWKERTAKLCMAVRESGEWSVVQENENENEKYCPSLPFVTGNAVFTHLIA